MKFDIQTRLAIDKGGGDAVKSEFKKVSDGARQASIDVKDLTKSIGAGISIFAIARQNLQALAPVLERNGQLARDLARSFGGDAAAGAVKALGLAMDSLINPSHIVENAIAATAEGSKRLQEAWVGETKVVLNLTAAQLKAVETYKESAAARAMANKAATDTIAKLDFELTWEIAHTAALQQGSAALVEWAAARATAAFVAAHPLATRDDVETIRALNMALAEELARQQELNEKERENARLAEERKRRAEEYKRELQAIIDRLNPVAAAERELQTQIAMVSAEFAKGGPNAKTYQDALAALRGELAALNGVAERTIASLDVSRNIGSILSGYEDHTMTGGSMTIEAVDTVASRYNEAFEDANKQLAAGLESGLTSAFSSALVEFAKGGDDAFKHFGEAMLDVLLNAVAEWLTAQLLAIAKAAAASKAIGGGSSGGGANAGSMGSMFSGGGSGGGAGMSAGVGWAAAFAAVLVGIYAVFKHQDDRQNAVDYETTARVNVDFGRMTASYVGRLNESGKAISDGLAGVIAELQAATGLWIQGSQEAEIAIRNDKQGFYLKINDEIVGQFKTAQEAMLAAVKHLFTDGQLSGELDKRIQAVINSFQGSDPTQLIENVRAVKAIIDATSGFTDIELAIRGLRGESEATEAQLRSMGLSIKDAGELSAQADALRRQSIRDQITGHQQTAAEEMAQRQREAAMFNAQLVLDRAEIAAEIAVLKAKLGIAQGANQIANADLKMQSAYLNSKLDLVEDEWRIENGRLVGIAAYNDANAALLKQMLEALQIAQSYLDDVDLILPGEIHLGRPGGGNANINTGPSEAEQRAQAFQDFLDSKFLASLPDLARRLEEINRAYEEQALAASEVAGGTARLAAARETELIQLRKELVDGLGLPLEATRDRFAALRETLNFLRDEVERTGQGGQRLAQILGEFGDMMRSELLGLAVYFTDALGDTEASAAFRRQMAEMEWDIRRAQFRLTVEELWLVGAISREQRAEWMRFLQSLPDDMPATGENGNQNQNPNNTQSNARNDARDRALDALRQALDRLRNAVEGLREFQEGMLLSSASPLTISDQTAEAARRYAELLARAQAGDVAAMEELAGAAQTYLDLLAQMYGTSGAGYSAIFNLISQQIEAIAAAGQAILDAAPAEMQGTEDRLDTIAEILAEIRRLYGSGGGRGNSAASMPGSLPGANASRSLGSAGNLTMGNFSTPGASGAMTVRDPELVAQVRALAEAQNAATVEAKADRMKKPAVGLSGFYGQPISGRRSA